eukprot:TRINITY_DN17175_c0_g1_i1.p1 TRINITY_DN17175_c0_g1~~TRINITY_DN17175_c0_g1_i1.p1  ORF type:complete len:107 (-),score=15.52 TRINITY_DN17175_c0_g1_i1:907-1227(-)
MALKFNGLEASFYYDFIPMVRNSWMSVKFRLVTIHGIGGGVGGAVLVGGGWGWCGCGGVVKRTRLTQGGRHDQKKRGRKMCFFKVGSFGELPYNIYGQNSRKLRFG